jgi:hypothetical protein
MPVLPGEKVAQLGFLPNRIPIGQASGWNPSEKCCWGKFPRAYNAYDIYIYTYIYISYVYDRGSWGKREMRPRKIRALKNINTGGEKELELLLLVTYPAMLLPCCRYQC